MKAINVPAEINSAKNENGKSEPTKTLTTVKTISPELGKPFSLTRPNHNGNMPSRPNEYSNREPAIIIPIKAVNIPRLILLPSQKQKWNRFGYK